MSIVEGIDNVFLHEFQIEELVDLGQNNMILKDEALTNITEGGKMLCSTLDSDMQGLYYDALLGADPLNELNTLIGVPTHFCIDGNLHYKTEEHTSDVSTNVMAGYEVVTHSDITMHTHVKNITNSCNWTPEGGQSLPSMDASFRSLKTSSYLETKTEPDNSSYMLPVLQMQDLKLELPSGTLGRSKKPISKTTPKLSLSDFHQKLVRQSSSKSSDSSGLDSECSSPPSSCSQSEAISSGDEGILVMDIHSPSPRKGRRSNRGHSKRKTPHLWQFLLEILTDERYNPVAIKWLDKNAGTFKFVKSQQVAKLWGACKNRTDMTYEFLSRALRHYYRRGIMTHISGKRLHYQFGDSAIGWREYALKSP